jgi:hypothetical protein
MEEKKERDVFGDVLGIIVVAVVIIAGWDQLRTGAEIRRAAAFQIASEKARLALTEIEIATATKRTTTRKAAGS